METSSSADETKDAHTNEDSSLGKSVVVLVCLAVKSKERKKYKKKKEQQKKKKERKERGPPVRHCRQLFLSWRQIEPKLTKKKNDITHR